MFVTTKAVKEVTMKKRRVHPGIGDVLTAVFKGDTPDINDLTLVHADATTKQFVFLQKKTSQSFVMCDGKIGTHDVDHLRSSEHSNCIDISMTYMSNVIQTVEKEIEIEVGEYIDATIGDDIVKLKVIYTGTKLVMIDEDTEEVFELEPYENPTGFSPLNPIFWAEH